MGARRPSEMSLAGQAAGGGGRPVVSAQFYTSPPKLTISKSPASSGLVPFLTVTDVSQAFAVFPEVETEIDHSAMFKVEGHLTGEAMGTAARRDEGWILMIPMEKDGETFTSGKRSDMLRWLAGEFAFRFSSLSLLLREADQGSCLLSSAFHDAFNLYGRPGNYSWDARDPKSLLFAHPVRFLRFSLLEETEKLTIFLFSLPAWRQPRRPFHHQTHPQSRRDFHLSSLFRSLSIQGHPRSKDERSTSHPVRRRSSRSPPFPGSATCSPRSSRSARERKSSQHSEGQRRRKSTKRRVGRRRCRISTSTSTSSRFSSR